MSTTSKPPLCTKQTPPHLVKPTSPMSPKQQLRQEQSAWHFLFENSRDAIVLVNMKGEVVDANSAFIVHLRSNRNDVYAMHIWDWDANMAKQKILTLLTQIDRRGVVFETRHQRTDNTIAHMEVTSNAFVFEDEALLLCICRDTTEKKLHDDTMQKLISTDPLTSLPNRREFTYHLKDAVHQVSLGRPAFSILLIDIDKFKSINDKYGHLFGDQALINIANLMSQLISERDLLSRWGGEEFTILMPNTDTATAVAFAERLRSFIEQQKICDTTYLTVSIGVTTWHQDDDLNSVFKRADDAMYGAKSQGRNCVKAIQA